jgi:hypothetical protein
MAGDLTVEGCGSVFASSARQASSNYGVGSDGRIGCYVDEDDAAWTSANWDNDNRAVTLEVADYDTYNWSPSDAAYKATIDLCVDICKRNGIQRLVYTGGPDGTMTEHLMFSATGCPGPWWHARMAQVTEEINARLAGVPEKEEEFDDTMAECLFYVKSAHNGYKAGDIVYWNASTGFKHVPHMDCVNLIKEANPNILYKTSRPNENWMHRAYQCTQPDVAKATFGERYQDA